MIKRGMIGWDVSVLQFKLARRGVRVGGIDGVFGRNTLGAVRAFQSRRGLIADGLVGPATRKALRGKAVRLAPVKPVRGPWGVERPRCSAMLGRWARYYGVSPRLVRAVAWMESGFHWNVTSSAGAWGVMQVMPATWRFVERRPAWAGTCSAPRAETSASASSTSATSCASSTGTGGSRWPATIRARRPCAATASTAETRFYVRTVLHLQNALLSAAKVSPREGS